MTRLPPINDPIRDLASFEWLVQGIASGLARRLPANVLVEDIVAAGHEALWKHLTTSDVRDVALLRIRIRGGMLE